MHVISYRDSSQNTKKGKSAHTSPASGDRDESLSLISLARLAVSLTRSHAGTLYTYIPYTHIRHTREPAATFYTPHTRSAHGHGSRAHPSTKPTGTQRKTMLGSDAQRHAYTLHLTCRLLRPIEVIPSPAAPSAAQAGQSTIPPTTSFGSWALSSESRRTAPPLQVSAKMV